MHKIMIADDEVIERALLERKLTKSFAGECEVISVRNGKEVLEADASFEPFGVPGTRPRFSLQVFLSGSVKRVLFRVP